MSWCDSDSMNANVGGLAVGVVHATGTGSQNVSVAAAETPAASVASAGRPTNHRDRIIRTKAGLDDVRLHDLRHSFASVAVSGGASLPIIGALLGHMNSATTQRYAHLHDNPVRAASEAVGSKIAASLS